MSLVLNNWTLLWEICEVVHVRVYQYDFMEKKGKEKKCIPKFFFLQIGNDTGKNIVTRNPE